ncbi:LamG domain-containing protein [Candidatus Woesearchaeota archaeon]|nr:LamG domain-containing protein [Candidatus Woesearchaeota archaeon]
MNGQKRSRLYTLSSIILFCLAFSFTVYADQSPTFIDPTFANNTLTSNTSIVVNVSITEPLLGNITYNWNGSNYTLYSEELVVMFNFDNLSGVGENYSGNRSNIFDASRNRNNGTWITNLTNETIRSNWTAQGRHGGAIGFDGIDDVVYISSIPGLSNATSITFSYWVKFPDNATSYDLSGFVKSGSGPAIRLGRSSTGGIFINPGTHTDISISHSINNKNQWYFLALTSAVGKNWTVYVDGKNISSGTNGLPSVGFAGDTPFGIGATLEPISTVWETRGFIDEPRIYNRSFTPEEIYTLYISNFQKVTESQWYFSANQSLNATDVLVNGTYTYQFFTKNTTGTQSSTEQRTIHIGQLPAVPEFGEWAVLLILISTVVGYFRMKQRTE